MGSVKLAPAVPLASMGRYPTVVIDPPWPLELAPQYRKRKSGGFPAKQLPYPSMSLEEIAALEVGEVLQQNSLLFCWTVNQFLWDVRELFEAWGVKRKFFMCWHKTNGFQGPDGPKYNGEYIVVGKRGNPHFEDTKAFWTVNSWPRRGHSVKPEEFYDLVRRITPMPRLDIFARRTIEGFDGWGNEMPAANAEIADAAAAAGPCLPVGVAR